MSAFLIYLIYLSGAISTACTIIVMFLGLALIIVGFMACLEGDSSAGERASVAVSWMWKAFAAILAVAVLIPDKQTIAMMIIVPVVTTPENLDKISKESRELYDLAKRVLENAAEPKKETKSPAP